MSFERSVGWLIGGSVLYAFAIVVAFIIVGLIYLAIVDDDPPLRAVVIPGILMANIASVGISWTSPYDAPGGSTVAAALGLNSGQSYPVVIGKSIDGTVGKGYFHGGLFASRGSVDLRPGSSVSMQFQSGENSYILQIPVSRLTFRQAPGPSRATIYLDNRPKGVGSVYGKFVSTDCNPALRMIVITRKCSPSLQISPETERQGLAPIVDQHLDSAIIQLSPEIYQKLLGAP